MRNNQKSQPKQFQIATANAAIQTLADDSGPRRFLIADEVGLGKTVVARTIIEKMMYRKRTPLRVFYISSNLNIAHQNRDKLLEVLPSSERNAAMAKADRLTLAADPATRPTHPRLHLYTLTPDTSVPMFRKQGSIGRMKERALIYRLLKGRFPTLNQEWFSEICQGRRGLKNWDAEVEFLTNLPGVSELQQSLLLALGEDPQFSAVSKIGAYDIEQAAQTMRRTAFIARLRTALARAALRDITPDIVIFDEFQKFRELLIPADDSHRDPVADALRGGSSGVKHGVLLLSATPYRLFTTRLQDKSAISHYDDFYKLISFLTGSNKAEYLRIKDAFKEFGDIMSSHEQVDVVRLERVRDKLENLLHTIMSRTERPEGKVKKGDVDKTSELKADDLRIFRYWAKRLGDGKPAQGRQSQLTSFAVPYWISAPLPMQTLGKEYVAWDRAHKRKRFRDEPVFRKEQRERLISPSIWPHPQFRALRELVPSQKLSLPWVTPSLPWWTLQGPWIKENANEGKLLIFSRFKAVPPAIAGLLSFDLEASFRSELGRNYERARVCSALQLKDNRPTLPALFFPSPTLIRYTDPLRDSTRSLSDVRKSMRSQVVQLARDLKIEIKKSGPRRPIWKLLPALEGKRHKIWPDVPLPTWDELLEHWKETAASQIETIRPILAQWNKLAIADLSYLTQEEISLIAEFSLGGPGVVLGRALYRFDPTVLDKQFGKLLKTSWNGLRPYLNKSLFKAVLTRSKKQPYTHAIPEAIVAGNFESVLDEHFWIQGRLGAESASDLLKQLNIAFGLPVGNDHLKNPDQFDGPSFSVRCHTAMPFTQAKVANQETGKEETLRTDDMRKAFNTPFWPHVLVTTSVGQEGLDFHVWCRQILHWDLCSGPIELEQREGRIQRFGSFSIRRALAEQFRLEVLSGLRSGSSKWETLSDIAERSYQSDAQGLKPWWTCDGEQIDRIFLPLHNSRESYKYRDLHQSRLLYRLALGQPHQQDFVKELQTVPDDGRIEYALRLSAWKDHGSEIRVPPVPVDASSA
jgi:hypothetical protein